MNSRSHEFHELVDMANKGLLKTKQGGKVLARRGRLTSAGRRSQPQGFVYDPTQEDLGGPVKFFYERVFDERLRDWEDIGRRYEAV